MLCVCNDFHFSITDLNKFSIMYGMFVPKKKTLENDDSKRLYPTSSVKLNNFKSIVNRIFIKIIASPKNLSHTFRFLAIKSGCSTVNQLTLFVSLMLYN